jgi:hypothetical protein
VAFTGTLITGTRGVFVSSGGPVVTVALGSALSFPSINNLGMVGFATGDAIFVGTGGPPTVIATTVSLQGLGDPIINDQGTVAFIAGLSGGGQGIFTGSGGPLTLIADTSGPFLGFSVFPVINSLGTVAFEAATNAGVRGIFTTADGSFTAMVDSSGPFSSFGFLSISNLGAVAFQAVLDTGVEGIFTGPDSVNDKVIAIGDPLFGSAVTGLSFFREGLNDMGQVAFRATLADGRQVVVQANPVPEVIEALISQVESIPSLNKGQKNSLITKLEAAERSLARENRNGASGQLNAFINQVQALERSGRLDAATADSLIAGAQAIINGL